MEPVKHLQNQVSRYLIGKSSLGIEFDGFCVTNPMIKMRYIYFTLFSKFLSLLQLLAAWWCEWLHKDFERKTVQNPEFPKMTIPSLCDLTFPSLGYPTSFVMCSYMSPIFLVVPSG